MAMPMSGMTENCPMRCTTPMAASASSAPMGVRAPYFTSWKLMTTFTMAMPACTQKLGRPKARMVRSMGKLRRMAAKRSRMGTSLRRQKYCSTAKHEQAQPSTVARALPMTPPPSPPGR